MNQVIGEVAILGNGCSSTAIFYVSLRCQQMFLFLFLSKNSIHLEELKTRKERLRKSHIQEGAQVSVNMEKF